MYVPLVLCHAIAPNVMLRLGYHCDRPLIPQLNGSAIAPRLNVCCDLLCHSVMAIALG
ncbi:MAG: hypothetical protein AB4042_21630 [Leptolyngbyaceae cyanobacterium]